MTRVAREQPTEWVDVTPGPEITEPEFVGESRHLLVEGLLNVFDQVRDNGTPIWVSLEAPAGAGKTRVAREFYARLAGVTKPRRQSEPPYWPLSILGATKADVSDVNARRKRVYPEAFDRPPGSLPSWMWWGIACYQRNGVPSLALVNDIAQLENHALWWTAAWSRHAPLESLGAKARDLRDVAAAWAKGSVEAKAIEVAVELAVGTLPFLGLFKKLVGWTRDQAIDTWKTHESTSAGSTIKADKPKDELLDDTVAMLRHLAVKGLPVVLFVEDLHLADDLLIKLLVTVLNTDSAVMVVTTEWPNHLDDKNNPEHLLWRGTMPERMIRIRHDNPAAPSPFPEGAGLSELSDDDLKHVVRSYFPHAQAGTLDGLVARYRNPLELELVCLQPKYGDDFPDGDLELTPAEIAKLPQGMRALFDLIWQQLPEPVQRGLALAAITQPAAIAAEAGEADERWLPSRLAAAAAAAFPDKLDVHASLRGEGRDYAWARVVDGLLRQFHEPVQRDVADSQADSLYSERGRSRIYGALAARVLAETEDAAAPPAVAAHRARTILALNSIGVITDPKAVIDATLTLVTGLYPFPREHKRLIGLVERAREAVGDHLAADGGLADDPATLRLRSYEASALGDSGRIEKAIEASRLVLDDQARVLGADHANTLSMRSNLAFWLGVAGHLEQALEASRGLLDDQTRVLGVDHEDTLTTRSNLASSMRDLGHLEQALITFHVLLDDQVRVLGADHRDTLLTRSNLASTVAKSGQVEQAASAFRGLLDDQVRVLGIDHMDTLTTRSNLAYLMRESGGIEEALNAFRALLDDQVRVLGLDHPFTLSTRNNLAVSVARSGQIEEATAAFRLLLDDQVRVLGPDHPSTLRTRSNLASEMLESGQIEQAIAVSRDLLNDRVRVLGANHPDTLSTRGTMAAMLVRSGQIEQAVDASRRLLDDQLRVLGANHPDTLTTQSILAAALAMAGQIEPAIDELQTLVDDQVRVLGANHPMTLTTRGILAAALAQSGKIEQAMDVSRGLLDDQIRVLGADDPQTLTTRSVLAAWLAQSGQVKQAMIAFHALLEDQLRVLGADHPVTTATRDLLAALQAAHSHG